MSARNELIRAIKTPTWRDDEAEFLVDAYAHELAEKIREHEWDPGCGGVGCCASNPDDAADLIDPEVG